MGGAPLDHSQFGHIRLGSLTKTFMRIFDIVLICERKPLCLVHNYYHVIDHMFSFSSLFGWWVQFLTYEQDTIHTYDWVWWPLCLSWVCLCQSHKLPLAELSLPLCTLSMSLTLAHNKQQIFTKDIFGFQWRIFGMSKVND